MRHIDDHIVKFYLKGPAYHYVNNNTNIMFEGSPWQRMSKNMDKELNKTIHHGISVGGLQSMVGHVYSMMCQATQPKWWGTYDKGGQLAIHTNFKGGAGKLCELRSSFAALGTIQKKMIEEKVASMDRTYVNNWSNYTQCQLSLSTLHVTTHDLTRTGVRNMVHTVLPVDDESVGMLLELVEAQPTFRVAYDNHGEQTVSIVPRESK